MGLASDSDAGLHQASADRSGVHSLFYSLTATLWRDFFSCRAHSFPLLHAGFHLRGLHIRWRLERLLRVLQICRRYAHLVAGVGLVALNPFVEGLRHTADPGQVC